MEQRLLEEGLDPSASSDERLSLLWDLLVRNEKTVSSLNQHIQDLHKQHNAEIQKVQQYVNEIKSLTKTRDSVALDLERENETLRVTLDEIHLQKEAQKSEITEMLLQEGLADIIPMSLSEQVAYLLADRASLLEKIQTRTDMDSKTIGHPMESTSQGFGKTVVKVEPLQGQSPWKKLLGLRKAAQTKHKLMPGTDSRYTEDSDSKGRSLQELERDVEEASARLAMAHKEIRRLTDELESAQMTQKAYEPELQEAQMEVEDLRREVEKLKRCELAELRKTKERNEKLEEELCHMRETKRLQTERLRFLEHEAADATANPPRDKKSQEEDIHKRCLEDMKERLNMIRHLTQVILKLQVEFEMETDLRRRTEEECEEHRRKRSEAEQLAQNFQNLCEKQAEDYRNTVGGLQVEIKKLVIKLQKLETQEVERHREEHLKEQLEENIKDLEKRLSSGQQETESLKTELKLALVSIDTQRSKYNDKQIHYKNKLSRTKALYLRETGWRNEKIKDLEKEIDIVKKQEEKMTDMMNLVTSENEALLHNKTDLLNQLHDLEEGRKNASDTISIMQMRMNLLEEENARLQQTAAQMSERIECLMILAETDCSDVTAESRVIEGQDQTTLPT
ncbi:uncharacterized protein [Misgurnus anguillicaudatus]|uniref:uncharacterized protein isoform X1 n=1 Tax=Misgurnus anguillicaudatus TaxID=75329 RepID=UPI003CCFDCEB